MSILYEDSSDEAFEIFEGKDVNSFLYLGESTDSQGLTMTSLRSLILSNEHRSKADLNESLDVLSSQRLSLAYERLHTMPKILRQELAGVITILDVSNNEFENIDFLIDFKQLTTLICDHNNITSFTDIPYLPNLELLWLNHCKIANLYPWAYKLQQSCPNLKYLSLMGNAAAPSYFNGGNFYDYLQYRFLVSVEFKFKNNLTSNLFRYFIISLFPKLIHLDDRTVSVDQRTEAQRLYKKPIIEEVLNKTVTLPHCFRSVKNKVQTLLATTPEFVQQRSCNCIV